MIKEEKDFKKNYYNNIKLFIAWFFLFFTIVIGAIITVSFLNSGTGLTVLFIVLFIIVFFLFITIFILYKIKIYQDSERIIIFGKKIEGISLTVSFTYGYEIKYENIKNIDLMPIKFYNWILSYQVHIKTYDPDITIYLHSISNLDKLFTRTRAFKFRPKKKKND